MSDSKEVSKERGDQILLVGLPGLVLVAMGVLGLVGIAGEAIHRNYGPVPLLIAAIVIGSGAIAYARRMSRNS